MEMPTLTISIVALLCTLSIITATPTGHLSQSDDGSYLADPGVPNGGYINGELLAQLLSLPPQAPSGPVRSPSKRQWCMKGMTYNHVIGACTLSFAAMRGRGRG